MPPSTRPRGVLAIPAIALVACFAMVAAALFASVGRAGTDPDGLGCVPVTGSSIDGVPTPVVCADSGLRPAVDGFSFPNWGGSGGSDTITTGTLVALFGAANVCAEMMAGVCTPTRAAQDWADQMNESLANGRCEGMSVLVERLFAGTQHLAALDPAAATVSDLRRTRPSVAQSIAYWWATQVTPEVAKAAADSRLLEPSGIVRDVVTGLRAGASDTLGIYGRAGAHAVTPFAVTYDGPVYSIWVYDSNHPGTAGRVIVDPRVETWQYQGSPATVVAATSPWSGSGPGGLEYTPMSVRAGDFTAPFSDDPRENPFAYTITATSTDPATPVDLRLETAEFRVDTAATGGADTPSVVAVRIDDDGTGYGTVAYVRDPAPLLVVPRTGGIAVPVDVSIDGPSIPWVRVHAHGIPASATADAYSIRADAADGIRITVADGEQVEVTIADGPDSLDHVPVVGPMIVRLRIDPATGRVEVTQSAWSPAEIP